MHREDDSEPNISQDEPVDMASMTLLIERAKGGCADSREVVFTQLQDYLERVASRQAKRNLMRKAGVSDIVQQSFVKVVQKFEDFRGNSSAEFRGWLKTLVINEAKQMRRSWASKGRDTSRETYIDDELSSSSNLKADDATPRSMAIRKEQARVLQAAIKKLPEDYQLVIRLRNFEQRSYAEIAEQMDRSVEAVTKLWYRAVTKLQASMQEPGDAN